MKWETKQLLTIKVVVGGLLLRVNIHFVYISDIVRNKLNSCKYLCAKQTEKQQIHALTAF